MERKNIRRRWAIGLGLLVLAASAHAQTNPYQKEPVALGATEARPTLVVLDMELTGDLGGPQFVAEHEARLKLANARLQEKLAATGLFQLIGTSRARATIDRLKAQHRYLHDCNGCDLEIGRQLGADQIFLAWVYRVSGLILTLTYEIHDVNSGQIAARKSFDFRGDTDVAWTHAINYMVRDIQESATSRAQ